MTFAELLSRARRRPVAWSVAVLAAAVLLFLLFGLRYLVPTHQGGMRLDRRGDGKTLVVAIRGLAGKLPATGIEDFVREAFPRADILVSTYEPSPFANIDPYRLADTIEVGINDAYQERHYERIVLVGYSLGAMVLRKALVWGYGIEEDRDVESRQGGRKWTEHVERFVSLAGVNRGWTISPKPREMKPWTRVTYFLAERIARATGTGKLLLSMHRGSPFIADLRVQWIQLFRPGEGEEEEGEEEEGEEPRKLPFVIHLLGDHDDLVDRADSQDLAAAKDTCFVTLRDTNHLTIANELSQGARREPAAASRARKIWDALLLPQERLVCDRQTLLEEDPAVTRVIYILHGIRDYGLWGEQIQQQIEAATDRARVVVVPPTYGYFPLLPFLLYGDRQDKVRWFMDQYTQDRAQYPHADRFDFVGHSNGTYVLASALRHYRTLRAGNVFFAGSVVPKRYPWRELVAAGRVVSVRNVMADCDWVVALFPRFLEQIAEWFDVQGVDGVLDIGSASFRGFDDARASRGRIRNVQFVHGGHSAGVDVGDKAKLDGIVAYMASGDDRGLAAFRQTGQPAGWLDLLSNVCWVVWLGLVAALAAAARFAVRFGWKGLALYAVVVLGILYSF